MSAVAKIRHVRPGLQTCAKRANEEILAIRSSNQDALDHAIKCGESLNDARVQVGHGEWLDWLAANVEVSAQHARSYMRIAARQDEVRSAGAKSIKEADTWLRDHSIDYESKVAESVELREEGLSQEEVARRVGVSQAAVSNWWASARNPSSPRKYTQKHKTFDASVRRVESAVARKLDRDQAMAKVGGEIQRAYGLNRRLIRSFDVAIEGEKNDRVRKALSTARQTAYRVEDEIVGAARIAKPNLAPMLRAKRGD